jgi:cytochrome P450
MNAAATSRSLDPNKPVPISSADFATHKYAYYRTMLDGPRVWTGKISVLKLKLLTRFEDCEALLRDSRFVRNRTTATGGGRLPFPLPKSIALIAQSMIVEDDPAHQRQRGLVNKAFTARAVGRLADRVETLTHELLDVAEKQGEVDLLEAYSGPIPVAVIGELVGIDDEDMPGFRDSLRVLSQGFSGWNVLRTLLWDLRSAGSFVSRLVEKKRANPSDDILSALIEAREEGDTLSHDELVGMVFLLIVAGFETTVHLITNAVATLLEHPDQLERLRAEPGLMDSAVEEIVRHRGPIHGTKMNYAVEDLTLCGEEIKRGTAVVPLLGAANHDPDAFEKPEVFDIAREPSHHLGFGFGAHYCLGAQLARLETSIALRNLLDRNPNLRLAVPPESLELQNMPMWHRYKRLPVALG